MAIKIENFQKRQLESVLKFLYFPRSFLFPACVKVKPFFNDLRAGSVLYRVRSVRWSDQLNFVIQHSTAFISEVHCLTITKRQRFFFHKNTNKQTNNWRKKDSLTGRKSHELKQIKYKGVTGLENKKMRY